MEACEGDFIESTDGLIFDVKSHIHPPDRVIAYLRYIPDRLGDRGRGVYRYRKIYSLVERKRILKEKWPVYTYFDDVFNEEMQGVPIDRIKIHIRPRDKLEELRIRGDLDDHEKSALELIDSLRTRSGLPWRTFGISGSIMVGLHTPTSDIDPIVYGGDASRKVHSTLQRLLLEEGDLRRYEHLDILGLYSARSMEESMAFEDFLWHERRKVLQGRFRGIDYFIRCVKRRDEVAESYAKRIYHPMGRLQLLATIQEDEESIFTPCRYEVGDVQIKKGDDEMTPYEVVSYRGRFCEQARVGERIMAEGKLEKVVWDTNAKYRLVIGEDPRDYMRVVDESAREHKIQEMKV